MTETTRSPLIPEARQALREEVVKRLNLALRDMRHFHNCAVHDAMEGLCDCAANSVIATLKDVRTHCERQADALTDAERARDEARADGWCDVCAGKGTPLSGGLCMCQGTGLAAMQVTFLREKLLHAEAERDALRRRVEALEKGL